MSSTCTIEANPDIAGIGVRVSIYVQALLALFPAAVALYKYGMAHTQVSSFGVIGEPEAVAEYHRQRELSRRDPAAYERYLRERYDPADEEERKDLRQTWMPVQVTGAALLVSAIIQAKLYRLDLYHALIVINLSWLNNMTALGLALTDLFLANPIDFFFGVRRNPRQLVPYIICALHLTATAAFSLWVFANLDDFGGGAGCNQEIHYWVFGHQVSATSDGFRRAGLVISGLAVCPMLNLSLEMLFSAIVGYFFQLPGLMLHIIIVSVLAILLSIITKMFIPMNRRGGLIKFFENLPIHTPARRVYVQTSPYAFMVMIFIIATEELIVINHDLVEEGENDWTFGQTLAMFVLLPVVLDVWNKLRRAWKLEIKKRDEGPQAVGAGDEEAGKLEDPATDAGGEPSTTASPEEAAPTQVLPLVDH